MKAIVFAAVITASLGCSTFRSDGSSTKGTENPDSFNTIPNEFDCSDGNAIEAYYATTSKSGLPIFFVKKPNTIIEAAFIHVKGDEIKIEEAGDFENISARKIVPNYKSVVWTLPIPRLNVSHYKSVTFNTTLLEVTSFTSVNQNHSGPTTAPHDLKCLARFAVF